MTRNGDSEQDRQDKQDRHEPQGFTSRARPVPGQDEGPPAATPRPEGSTEPDERLHNMGGTGPASIRGSNVKPGGQRGQVRGPAEPERHGEIVEDEEPGELEVPDPASPPTDGTGQGEHIGGGLDWVPSDEDDPDGGSGLTGADDGGYLPGEGTGRPYRD